MPVRQLILSLNGHAEDLPTDRVFLAPVNTDAKTCASHSVRCEAQRVWELRAKFTDHPRRFQISASPYGREYYENCPSFLIVQVKMIIFMSQMLYYNVTQPINITCIMSGSSERIQGEILVWLVCLTLKQNGSCSFSFLNSNCIFKYSWSHTWYERVKWGGLNKYMQ